MNVKNMIFKNNFRFPTKNLGNDSNLTCHSRILPAACRPAPDGESMNVEILVDSLSIMHKGKV